ncbi:MAG: DNA photolyase family protein [Candidatus Kapabacteria bacterium]|jgi:deoxyribodipyrimidine photo-lyase|nr:DNA photolyase family protein [Candidatus Kapabacteria bacterium]
MNPIIIFWFRRDLRLSDNAGLYNALKTAQEQGLRVLPLFIFDKAILDKLPDKRDRRVEFIHNALHEINIALKPHHSSLLVRYGFPLDVWQSLLQEYSIKAVFTNHDYEPYATERDAAIQTLLTTHGITFHTFKDQTIFEKSEILTGENRPYTVFTPYSRKWKGLLSEAHTQAYPVEQYASAFAEVSAPFPLPSLAEMGFEALSEPFPAKVLREDIIRHYDRTRDFPAQQGTTRLSVHLRFGTVSVRECVRTAREMNETWLNELIWRDFYMQILWHFPRIVEESFKPDYDRIQWRRDENDLRRWCDGTTGYPIVDAGMRELNSTGYMHNRVRMITASFLTKHLLLDWRWGERYFAQKLLDFDLAANNGGWQWAAGTGCDAAPYFRVFSPDAQTEKFDAKHDYIKKWVPEFGTNAYPKPIVEHKFARERALATYKQALKPSEGKSETGQEGLFGL